jgi:glycosyltransferase involved in cell wall biosynthesis
VVDGPLLSDAVDQLRAEGFRIGPDKLHRLRVFGIRSTRDGRNYRITAAALADLRYVLSIERAMQFARDWDGLSLELAYREYHTIPWGRAHRGACDRIEAAFARIDRELHRANDWSALGFHKRRVPHLANQLANHFVPKQKINVNPNYQNVHDIIDHLARMLLPVIYNDEPFLERDVIRLIVMSRVPEEDAIKLAPLAMKLLEQITPFLRQGRTNKLKIVTSGDATECEVRDAVRMMRTYAMLGAALKVAGVSTPIRPVPSYPHLEDLLEFTTVDAALRSVMYAAAFDTSHHQQALENVARFQAGEAPEINTAIESLAATWKLVPKVLGVDHA